MVMIARASVLLIFPVRIIVVGAMNSCPSAQDVTKKHIAYRNKHSCNQAFGPAHLLR